MYPYKTVNVGFTTNTYLVIKKVVGHQGVVGPALCPCLASSYLGGQGDLGAQLGDQGGLQGVSRGLQQGGLGDHQGVLQGAQEGL